MSYIFGRVVLFATLAFIEGYLIWYYRVGERKMVYEALAYLSGGQRQYLSGEPHYIILSEADKERLIQKKNKRLLKMIIILIVAVSLAAFQDGHFGIVIAALLVGCALYVLLKARYEGILSGVVYGVKAVCISATHPVRGRGKYIYTYKLAYYDFMKSAIDGKIMATERGGYEHIVKRRSPDNTRGVGKGWKIKGFGLGRMD